MCQREAEADTRLSKTSRDRIGAMLGFAETLDDWYGQMMKVPSQRLMMLIRLGSKITLNEVGSRDKEDYMLVGKAEADPQLGKISNESPLGKAVIGHKANDIVEVASPAGPIQ